MCCKNLWKNFVPFVLALLLGLFTADLSQKIADYNRAKSLASQNRIVIKNTLETKSDNFNKQGSGHSGMCLGEEHPFNKKYEPKKNTDPNNQNLKILSKPRPIFTDLAKQNNTQGVIRLRVVFFANGEIGKVTLINGLPDGLTEQTVSAAKLIKFEPAKRNGQPITVTKIVEYNFTLY